MGWISVEERTPKEFTDVLIKRLQPKGEFPFIETGYYANPMKHHESEEIAFPGEWTSRMGMEFEVFNEISKMFNGMIKEIPPVTHWMELPAPPKEVEQ